MASKRTERFSVVLGAVDKISAPIRRVNRKIDSITAPIKRVRRQMSALAREAGFGKLGSSISGFGRQLARFGAIGAAAVGGILFAMARAAERMDTLAKRTRALGFPSDEFQRWKQVAQLAGVEAEKFDKGIQDLNKHVGELRAGQGTLTTFLKKTDQELGRQLVHAKDSNEAFGLIIDRLREMPSAFDRAALANAAFGRAGKQLINVAELSTEEIAKLKAQVEAEGGIISAQSLRNAELFQDSLLLLKTAVSNVWNEISGSFFPVLTSLMDRIRSWTSANRELIKTKVIDFLKRTVATGERFASWLETNTPKIEAFVKAIGGMKTILIGLAVVALAPLITAVIAVGTAFGSTAGLITLAVGGIAAAIAFVILKWEKLTELFDSFVISPALEFFADPFGLSNDNSPRSAAGAAAGISGGVPRNDTLRVVVDQRGAVVDAQVETGSSLEISTEGVAGRAF